MVLTVAGPCATRRDLLVLLSATQNDEKSDGPIRPSPVCSSPNWASRIGPGRGIVLRMSFEISATRSAFAPDISWLEARGPFGLHAHIEHASNIPIPPNSSARIRPRIMLSQIIHQVGISNFPGSGYWSPRFSPTGPPSESEPPLQRFLGVPQSTKRLECRYSFLCPTFLPSPYGDNNSCDGEHHGQSACNARPATNKKEPP